MGIFVFLVLSVVTTLLFGMAMSFHLMSQLKHHLFREAFLKTLPEISPSLLHLVQDSCRVDTVGYLQHLGQQLVHRRTQ